MKFGSAYIYKLNEYIEQNIDTLTCNQLADLYFDFISEIESLGAESKNVKGMTELIVFRAYYYANKEMIDSNNITIRRNVVGTARQPDMVVYCDAVPIKSIEVKSNFYNIKTDFSRHEEVVLTHQNIKIGTIAFEVQKLSHQKLITKLAKSNSFYQVLVLKDCKEKFIGKLDQMGLMLT